MKKQIWKWKLSENFKNIQPQSRQRTLKGASTYSLTYEYTIKKNMPAILNMFKICGAKPQACSLHILLAVPELLSAEQSPRGRTVGRPAGLFWAVGNAGGGSVCAWHTGSSTVRGLHWHFAKHLSTPLETKHPRAETYKRREMSVTKNLTLK